jgi:hypothetical protein
MPKRKDVPSLDELLGGKPKSTPASTPAHVRQRTPKPSPVKSASVASTSKARPATKRSDRAIAQEYAKYGRPWAVRLPPDLIAELKRIAKAERVNYNALTRWVVQQFTADYKAGRIDLGKAKRPKGYEL